MRLVQALPILIPLFFQAAFASEPDVDQLADELLKLMPPGTITHKHVCQSNGISIATFKVNELLPKIDDRSIEFQKSGNIWTGVEISEGGLANPAMSLSFNQDGENNFGFIVNDRKTGALVMSAWDSDGDGHLDGLRYTTVDAAGDPVMVVSDFGMDGQLDLKIHYDKPLAEIWYKGQWRKIEKKNEKGGILIDGKFRPLKTVDGRIIVE